MSTCVCVCGDRPVCAGVWTRQTCLSAFFSADVWSSAPPWMRVPHIRVLYTQHDVVVGAGAAVLPQQSSRLQQRSLACHRHVACSPGFTVVGGQTDAHGTGAVPHQLLRPGGQGRRTVSQAEVRGPDEDQRLHARGRSLYDLTTSNFFKKRSLSPLPLSLSLPLTMPDQS